MKLEPSKIEKEALQVLQFMQVRDFPHLDMQMEMQKDEVFRDLSFGRLALSIPEQHYEVLTMAYPALQSSDAMEKTLAWKAFMATPLSIPYKPNSKQQTM